MVFPMTGPSPLDILQVTPESARSEDGRTGDMTDSLALTLAHLGHSVTIITPRYRGVEISSPPFARLRISFGDGIHEADLIDHTLAKRVRVIFVDYAPFYNRAGLYGTDDVDYPDSAFRFALLSRVAADVVGTHAQPTVVHAHEWQTGLTPVTVSRRPAGRPHDPQPRLPGRLRGDHAARARPRLGRVHGDRARILGAGQLSQGGHQLQRFRHDGQSALCGGDPDARVRLRLRGGAGATSRSAGRHPQRDRRLGGIRGHPHLPATYGARNLEGKSRCKLALLRAFGLPHDGAALNRPLIGMVSRVDQGKPDLLSEASVMLPGLDATFAIVAPESRATGDVTRSPRIRSDRRSRRLDEQQRT
jgi:starch synthase